MEVRPRVGTFVAVPSRRELTELFQMKELLEGDAERYAALVHEFHDLIVKGADNSKLEAHYRTLMNQLAYARLVRTSLSQPGRLTESDSEHHRVLTLHPGQGRRRRGARDARACADEPPGADGRHRRAAELTAGGHRRPRVTRPSPHRPGRG
ncbi:transcriptional regulator, GntR family protein [Streptomyces bingchenggensis BCW-1]|uniref:Transcriptional regulator, GntR family protein n=1 Tax=Streptomyces bingchenggensis (strain BCW-1) TaxID=749414 RepID=D7C660_STRBB|nr:MULTISPECIES: FCD domain-containing protein [Streptomyces]ADI04048.1 transcriptional regulator, GntR family protein [Streptomyces bingchenggensis BCW-1]